VVRFLVWAISAVLNLARYWSPRTSACGSRCLWCSAGARSRACATRTGSPRFLHQSVVRRSAQIASHCQAPRRCRGGIDGAGVVTGPSDHLRERKIRIWVSAWTIGKYMTPRHHRGPSPGWREFLELHESTIWAFRLLLHSNHLVSDALRLFCGPARQ
jgi:hypothetical protein